MKPEIIFALLLALALAASGHGQSSAAHSTAAAGWWSHVEVLADDKLEGRDTGSEGYRRAAAYVASQFARAGLKPGGTSGYFQSIRFKSRRILEEQSSLSLVRNGMEEPINLGGEAMINMRVEPAAHVEAPLVFIGYGLHAPAINYDDLAGLDLKGKVAVLLIGSPPNLSVPVRAYYQSKGWSSLRAAGAVGLIAIQNPQDKELPWARGTLARLMPALTLADASLAESSGQRLSVTLNPAAAEKFFAGSGHTFQEIADLDRAGKPLPKFALAVSVRASVAVETARLESPNVIGILLGNDPKLKHQYVVISAHLDHLGVGKPINGDTIYNGAMDNASGVAALIETAMALQAAHTHLRRSVIFLALTGEEKGLLGSKYFVAHPPVPASSIVADVNTDMFLPLFPLRSLIVNGLEESDLANDLRHVGEALKIKIIFDPEPERNAFIRSDQYSFIRRGIPSVSLKMGFTKDSPEYEIIKRWRTEHYHAPSDDLKQTVDLQAAADYNRLLLNVVEMISNRLTRPEWNKDSIFKRLID